MRPRSDNQYSAGPVNWRIIRSLLPYLSEFRGRVFLAMACLVLGKLAGVAVPRAPALQVTGGEVCFEGVCFAYQADRSILHEISFTIPAGHTLAVVGPGVAGYPFRQQLLAANAAYARLWAEQQKTANPLPGGGSLSD